MQTKPAKHEKFFTPFALWLQKNHQNRIGSKCGFTTTDVDFVWRNYRDAWFITIEEKCRRTEVPWSQAVTHGILVEMLQFASGKKILVNDGSAKRHIEYRGHFFVQFSGTTPDDGWMKINGVARTVEQLIELLTTGRIRQAPAAKNSECDKKDAVLV